MSAFVGVAICLFGETDRPCPDHLYKCDRFGQMLQPVPAGESVEIASCHQRTWLLAIFLLIHMLRQAKAFRSDTISGVLHGTATRQKAAFTHGSVGHTVLVALWLAVLPLEFHVAEVVLDITPVGRIVSRPKFSYVSERTKFLHPSLEVGGPEDPLRQTIALLGTRILGDWSIGSQTTHID